METILMMACVGLLYIAFIIFCIMFFLWTVNTANNIAWGIKDDPNESFVYFVKQTLRKLAKSNSKEGER